MQGKKPESDDPIEQLLNSLKRDIEDDRAKLSGVLDKLIQFGKDDADRMVAVAETVAKIGDSLTKQNHLRVDAIKALSRRNMRPENDREDDPFDDIGSAFGTSDEVEN